MTSLRLVPAVCGHHFARRGAGFESLLSRGEVQLFVRCGPSAGLGFSCVIGLALRAFRGLALPSTGLLAGPSALAGPPGPALQLAHLTHHLPRVI